MVIGLKLVFFFALLHARSDTSETKEYSTENNRHNDRLEHEMELIEPVELKKEKGPARVYYGLTDNGHKLYDELLKQIIFPVQKLLPKES